MPDEEMLEEIEEAGRDTDNMVGHLTVGEIVIPRNIADDKDAQKVLAALFESYDIDMEEFTVGHEKNKINPETGYPEFFLKKAFSPGLLKALSQRWEALWVLFLKFQNRQQHHRNPPQNLKKKPTLPKGRK